VYNLEVGDGYSWLIKLAQIGKFYITTPSYRALTGGLVRLVNTWTLKMFFGIVVQFSPLGVKPFCSRSRGQMKCDGTRAETRFRLSARRTSPFKSAGASVQSTNDSRGVCISGSNAGYTMFRGSVKSTGCPLHSPVSPFTSPPCGTVCHHISTVV